MSIERERKFLVDERILLPVLVKRGIVAKNIETGYFTHPHDQSPAIRVSLRDIGTDREKCKICFKGKGTIEREEFEYTIPSVDAKRLVQMAPTFVKKQRFEMDGWEIDRIELLSGVLWIAEWEEAEGKMEAPVTVMRPDWIIKEVTDDVRFANQYLAYFTTERPGVAGRNVVENDRREKELSRS